MDVKFASTDDNIVLAFTDSLGNFSVYQVNEVQGTDKLE